MIDRKSLRVLEKIGVHTVCPGRCIEAIHFLLRECRLSAAPARWRAGQREWRELHRPACSETPPPTSVERQSSAESGPPLGWLETSLCFYMLPSVITTIYYDSYYIDMTLLYTISYSYSFRYIID